MKIIYYSWNNIEKEEYFKELINNDYNLITTESEEELLKYLESGSINIVLFDTISIVNYKKLFTYINKYKNNISFIAITNLNNDFILNEALSLGLDDYIFDNLTKEQFVAKINAFIKISTSNKIPIEIEILKIRDLELNPLSREVKKADKYISLTNREFALLEFLIKNKGKVVTRKKLIETFWADSDSTTNNSPDVYITFLRRKIENPAETKIIKTIRNIGYMVKD